MDQQRFEQLKTKVQESAPDRYKIGLVNTPNEAAEVLKSFNRNALIDIQKLDESRKIIVSEYVGMASIIKEMDADLKRIGGDEDIDSETRKKIIKDIIFNNVELMKKLKTSFELMQKISQEIQQLSKFIEASNELINEVANEIARANFNPSEVVFDEEPLILDDEVEEISPLPQLSEEPLSQTSRDSFNHRFSRLLTEQAKRFNSNMPINREAIKAERQWLQSQIGKTLTADEAQKMLTFSVVTAETKDPANMKGFISFLEKMGIRMTLD